MKKISKLILLVLLALILTAGGFMSWITLNDYKPAAIETLDFSKTKLPKTLQQPRIHMASWNIGYGGLGKDMDFFYDGGVKSRATLDQTNEYFSGVLNIISFNPTIDIWMLQEVDKKAKRTYFIDEPQRISEVLSNYVPVFATNYKVPFVPVPLTHPMGEVEAGLMTLSNYTPSSSRRVAYPEIASWPENLFLLDRCFLEVRIPVRNHRELVMINTHNSAFVNDQELMNKELAVIRNTMMKEFYAGNYVVAGGDWNMNPFGYTIEGDFNLQRFVPTETNLGKSFMPADWQVVFDPKAPTNRHLDVPFTKGQTGTTTIDYFVVSPNIKVNKVITTDMDFAYSDHNPVFIDFELKDFY